MKHSGKARRAALKLILLSLAAALALVAGGFLLPRTATYYVALTVVAVWVLFVWFTLYFFRDPNAKVPSQAAVVLSPGHGKVDVIDQVTENNFMGGRCRRISIFLSVIDIHVQNAPVSGTIGHYHYTTGQFMSALKTESAEHNENLLLGFVASDPAGAKVGVRLIAGVLARRIVPFATKGEQVARGERISLIQFGSRTDVYLPLSANIKIKLGDRVVGGETVLAALA